MQSHHQAGTDGRSAFFLVEHFPEMIIKILPINLFGQSHQSVIGIKYVDKFRYEKVALWIGLWRALWFHQKFAGK
jgi:hypothetical protein